MYVYVRACVHAYVRTCVRAYVRTCVRAYVRTCVRAYVRTCVRAYVRARARTHARTHATYVWMHVCSMDVLHHYVHVSMFASMHACMHTCMHAHTYACAHAWLKGLSCIPSRCVDKVVVHTNTVNQQSLGHFIILLGSAQAVPDNDSFRPNLLNAALSR